MLRRAFSIAALRPRAQGCDIDVIYRVVGVGTRWMASLKPGERASVLGPRGNTLPIVEGKRIAWLVAGGVGLPPMLWLAEALGAAGKNVVFFYGAQTASLLALEPSDRAPARVPLAATVASPLVGDEGDDAPSTRDDATVALGGAEVVLATDDGSRGFHGHVGQALAAYTQANPLAPTDVVVYTCGPQRMMRFVADYCATRRMACFACMEQSMACGTGTCQSCVLPVRDASDPAGWRYALCCTEGPVFNALDVEWDFKVR